MESENKHFEEIKSENQLMEEILKVRFTDLEQERDLCKQLLGIAEPKQHMYACAFANVYLMDSHLALGEFDSCDFYILKANFLCRKYGFQDLLLTLCNCAGLYYLKLNDEQTALQYYLEGLKLATGMQDHVTESKILNNIGLGFAGRDDWSTAKEHFERAFQALEPFLDETNSGNVISYLGNLSEACEMLGDVEEGEQVLKRCEEIGTQSPYQRFRLLCGWLSHYAKLGDRKRCIRLSEQLMNEGFLEYENRYFVCDMLGGLCESMMEVGEEIRAGKFLKLLKIREAEAPLMIRYDILRLEIRYKEVFAGGQQLDEAYRAFYEVSGEIAKKDYEARSRSMLSKIQLTEATLEWEHTYQQNQELRHAGQVDELTGLYNRRYFNKLISKVSQSSEVSSLGYIMLDVDYFKQYNDSYGHFMGDNALRTVASVLSRFAVEGIHVSRYGGDEFVCLCENLSDEEVERYVNQIRDHIFAEQILHEASKSSNFLSLSIGYCNEPFASGMPTDRLLELADQALYLAKEAGRNCIRRVRDGGTL